MTTDRSRDETGVDESDGTAAGIRSRPSIAIIKRVANETGISPLELPPLNETVDVDALDRLLEDGDPDRPWPTLVFRYVDYRVRVGADGEIEVTDPDEDGISVVDEWTHVSVVEEPDDRPLAVRLVSAIADRSGWERSRVRTALAEIADPDALTQLNRRRENGVPRPGATVLFSVLGYDVVVDAGGTISLGSTLGRLKRTGGNVLIVGGVPDDLVDVASTNLLGDPDRNRRRLFALLDRNPGVVTDRLGPTSAGSARIVDYAISARSVATTGTPVGEGGHVVDEPTDLDEFAATVATRVRAFETGASLSEPGDLRLCVDSLRPIIDERGAEGTVALLEPIREAVRDVSGLGHFVLPVGRESPVVERLEPSFDATVELRAGDCGPQQRWHLHESGYTTDWIGLGRSDER
ncbi:DUF7504 family protein [Natronococcus occultus]|uniref:Halobacterial output domain-containing protein n=1 Tax=Natronococcus occultus SP4 TaxID=694430 RepID=L0K3U1_9EURY|nr:HalOD1 output domain-containing protein [Natronococcus occultus]AGB39220.1 hypothetical protein Natoc_3493 [Natronococcus occultus SP4]